MRMLLDMHFKAIALALILFRHALVPALTAIDSKVTEIKSHDGNEVLVGEGKSVLSLYSATQFDGVNITIYNKACNKDVI